ncbi:TRAP transporter small permease [Aureimonas altamirensis]|uniref:TRAP transporter small permease n=1 Tax=Aureimonas altamirensis TaxID=370622 RepID=UPI001E35E32D|nr:TRAP transporter small permease [Aureimonas altamirensis]UHD46391.1 TRAP transporter small permease [Aureimonas altamirensis]
MNKVLNLVEAILDKVLIALFMTMVVAIVWQVVARYVFAAPTVWSEELARFMLVWVTMLGSAYVLEHGGHVALTVFVELLPPALQHALMFLRDLIVVAMAGGLAWYGYALAVSGGRRVSTGLGLSMTYAYAAIPVGAVLIAFFLLARRICGPREN